MGIKQDIRNGVALPQIVLPGQRRLTGGKNLDGSFWLEIEGQGRIVLPPENAIQMAVGILRAAGVLIEEISPQAVAAANGG